MKTVKYLVTAFDTDPQGFTVIQAEHANKAFSVHLLLFVAHKHLERLHHSEGYKITHLAERTDTNMKLVHQIPPILYKLGFLRYNSKNPFPIIADK